ncbi:MAG: S9 family peptidase [Microbacteriaceae bacterium]|nr:S9 family peptidase [Microbacteriaceae bacterium]
MTTSPAAFEASAPNDPAPKGFAPVAKREPRPRTHHGHTFIDDYEWLREKSNPEVIAHLEAENAWTATQTAHLTGLAQDVFEEIKTRTQETDLSVPVRRGAFWYYTRTVQGESYGVYCRAPISGPDDWTPPVVEQTGVASQTDTAGSDTMAAEEVLLDANAEATGHEFFSLGSFDISTDGTRLLWAVDVTGEERYTLRTRVIATGEINPLDEVANTAGGALFSLNGDYIFYTTVDDSWRPDTVWRHAVGTAASDDVTVFTEPDDRFWVGVGRTRSRKYLVIELGSKVTSEIHLLDADDPTGELRVVWPRVEGVEYDLEHAVVRGEDRLLITHNDGAENFCVESVAARDPRGERTTVVAPSAERRIDGVDAFAHHLVISYRREVLTRLGVIALESDGTDDDTDTDTDTDDDTTTHIATATDYGELHEVEFNETLYDIALSNTPEWYTPSLRLSFASFVTPATVLDYDLVSQTTTVLKRQPVLGGYLSEHYEQARDWVVASDGARIPISLVWRKDARTSGAPAPTLLYGYGSYEASMDPSFSIARLSLLDRGVLYVIAHVRGGGELGRAWYDSGKMLAKRNTFTDFVAVAQHLIDTGQTTPPQLVAEGRSAGGLLVGAAVNLAPQLFGGILAGVPFVDALTSILDPDLPLTVIEWDEWGDPLHDAAVYEYMRGYSPYENVRTDAAYPPILAVTSLNDTRVLYVEPAKWAARLRTVGAPVLLKTEMTAGHGGASGRYAAWRERSTEYAWVLATAGAVPPSE